MSSQVQCKVLSYLNFEVFFIKSIILPQFSYLVMMLYAFGTFFKNTDMDAIY
jgi:hypothetical protein